MPLPTFINLNTPDMGGKCWVLDEKGLFVLESTSGVLRTIACTHAGSGSIIAYDGIPDAKGYFPDEHLAKTDEGYNIRNGRPLYKANPAVMGSWMMDGGFHHGLTIRAEGGTMSASVIASIVWMPYKKRVIVSVPNA